MFFMEHTLDLRNQNQTKSENILENNLKRLILIYSISINPF